MNDGACPAYRLPMGETCTHQRNITDITKEKHNDERIDQERKQRRPPGRCHHSGARSALGQPVPQVVTELEKPLDPSLVSQRKGRAGRTYQYIEGHTVIDQANRIFGFAGWGYEVVGDVTLREIEQVDPKTGEMSRIHAYSAPVRVTVPGAPPRTDIGFHVVAEESGEGHDTACKGAVTDGLKRALRSFGDQFGNCLYGDQAATGQPAKQESAADSLAPSLRATLIDLGAMQGFDEKQVRAAVKGKTGKDLEAVSASELTPLVQGATHKLQQTREAEVAEAA